MSAKIERAARSERPCVLTIAGSDSGGGAGIQADLRTIHALGGFGTSAITAITAQNTRRISGLKALSEEWIERQVEAVLEDLPVRAIKTGLLPHAAGIRAIARVIEKFPKIPLVVDPVLASSRGERFLSVRDVQVLKTELFPRALLVTPNWPEATELTGQKVNDVRSAEAAGIQIMVTTGCAAVLVKGGHGVNRICEDVLVMRKSCRIFRHARIATSNTHGTGCVLSAGIATGLACGYGLEEAVDRAIDFLTEALKQGRRRDWGGRGPAYSG